MFWKDKIASRVHFPKSLDDWSSGSTTAGEKGSSALPSASNPKDPSFGVDAITKTFYEGKNSGGGHYDWVETPPKQLNKKISRVYDRVAVKIYMIKDHEQPTISGRTPLKIQMIDVQSPILVNAIKDIVKDEDVFLEATETARFNAPFKPLFFCYDKIRDLHESLADDNVLKAHVKILLQVMADAFGGFMTHLKHLRASGLISYKLAWTYFPKNSIIYGGLNDCERLCKVLGTEYLNPSNGPPTLQIACQEIAFNGESFGWKTTMLEIPVFAGNLPVTSLPSYPLSFHEDQAGLKARLTARGQKVLDYQELAYREYAGVGLHVNAGKLERHNISGRILVDYFGYSKHHEGLHRVEMKECQSDENSTYIKRLGEEKQRENKNEMLGRKDDLVFISPILRGFSLKAKLWLNFYVDDIKPVVWNDEAYSHLVYSEEQKDLVLTFVENHQRLKAGVDDVIMGKGQGLILLLSGPPGTGKTLTAEAVADKTRRPLYYLQAEDLGTNAALLGSRIKKIFEMATEWNAVILLDEADVFMAERSPEDIVRNELVSIFLRELEYFQGIIFLTTNLYSTIDAAFRSRVNIHLLFTPLPFSSRLVLWRKFLSRLPDSATIPNPMAHLSENDLEVLARWELNGREIKNAIKTVRTWCVCKGYDMSLLRLESGIRVTAPQAIKVEEIE